ncbi:MAG: hypothetical protein WDZ63_01665 [Burkholderiales bacterium]
MTYLTKITVVLLIVLALLTFTRYSRRRHIERFGRPPAGTHARTLAFFVMWSTGFVAIGWLSPHALAITLAACLLLFFVLGAGARPWSLRQQLRDGGIFSAASVGTLALVAFYGMHAQA